MQEKWRINWLAIYDGCEFNNSVLNNSSIDIPRQHYSHGRIHKFISMKAIAFGFSVFPKFHKLGF